MRKIAPLLVLIVASGCGGGSSYSNLLDLRDDAVKAGLPCSTWHRADVQADDHSVEGQCSEDSVLILYPNADARAADVKRLRSELADYGMSYTLLVGDNWVINSPDAADLKSDMGGEVIQG